MANPYPYTLDKLYWRDSATGGVVTALEKSIINDGQSIGLSLESINMARLNIAQMITLTHETILICNVGMSKTQFAAAVSQRRRAHPKSEDPFLFDDERDYPGRDPDVVQVGCLIILSPMSVDKGRAVEGLEKEFGFLNFNGLVSASVVTPSTLIKMFGVVTPNYSTQHKMFERFCVDKTFEPNIHHFTTHSPLGAESKGSLLQFSGALDTRNTLCATFAAFSDENLLEPLVDVFNMDTGITLSGFDPRSNLLSDSYFGEAMLVGAMPRYRGQNEPELQQVSRLWCSCYMRPTPLSERGIDRQHEMNYLRTAMVNLERATFDLRAEYVRYADNTARANAVSDKAYGSVWGMF